MSGFMKIWRIARMGLLMLPVFLTSFGHVRAQGEPLPESLWYAVEQDGKVQVNLYFFYSETCPHCAKAASFLPALVEPRPWLRLGALNVDESQENRELFAGLAGLLGEEFQGVPAFFLCGRMVVGFDSAEGMGAGLAAFADQCHAALVDMQTLGPQPAPAITEVEIPFLGRLDAGNLSLPLLTLALGGADAFNPCAFFVLLFLMSLRTHARSRARMLLIGGIFVACSGIFYLAFMAAWLNLFLLLEGMAIVTTVAGLVAMAVAALNIKDYFLFNAGPSLSIPMGARNRLFGRMGRLLSSESLPSLLAGTLALAVAANAYELLCTSGLPLVYTRILTLEELPTATYYGYLALYNLVYVLPLLAIVLVFTATLGARKLGERGGRLLKLMSGLMMLGLGIVLLIRPELLDNVLTAFALIAAAGALTGIAALVERSRAQAT
ncbi:MAG: thioredoxin family protein [Proteobacteria bacterium]|nr:thioredoxin family protein [Pseudomonadota bacterium]